MNSCSGLLRHMPSMRATRDRSRPYRILMAPSLSKMRERRGCFTTPSALPTPNPVLDDLQQERAAIDDWIDFGEIEIQELDRYIENVKRKSAPGNDGISNWHPGKLLMKELWPSIREVFFHIITSCYSMCYFPQKWKCFSTAILKKPKKPDYSVPKP
ncbi:hypothetical protein BT69DRAFT_1370629 [Atractiella rhizophila]|nr:hypothetical protein BT69DRAFT_1370629 [Atractiella rhizophila]